MSNATQEFSFFKQVADRDKDKSPLVTIVDCAQGGQAMAEWVDSKGGPWREADRRLQAARVSPKQVQVAWIKLANKGPSGDLQQHGKKLQKDTLAVCSTPGSGSQTCESSILAAASTADIQRPAQPGAVRL